MKTRPEEFEKFHKLLMQNAPEGYTPHYFPVMPNGKDPDSLTIAKKTPQKYNGTRGNWKAQHARLTYEEAITRLKAGGNVGIAAMENDPLIIIDADTEENREQLTTKTLTVTSRKRFGGHAFHFIEAER